MVEPTIETLADGRLLVVLRGSNDKKPELPGYRWVCYSSDGGLHCTKPLPWTYENGELFFSPSACSQLLRHTSGRPSTRSSPKIAWIIWQTPLPPGGLTFNPDPF